MDAGEEAAFSQEEEGKAENGKQSERCQGRERINRVHGRKHRAPPGVRVEKKKKDEEDFGEIRGWKKAPSGRSQDYLQDP